MSESQKDLHEEEEKLLRIIKKSKCYLTWAIGLLFACLVVLAAIWIGTVLVFTSYPLALIATIACLVTKICATIIIIILAICLISETIDNIKAIKSAKYELKKNYEYIEKQTASADSVVDNRD